MKYKIAYEGYSVVEVEAKSKKAAVDKFWEDGLNDLYNADIVEVVPAAQNFKFYTDLNQ